MYFRLIRPSAADFMAHMTLLKPAFDGSDDPKGEFEYIRDLVRDQQASFYLLTGKGIKLWFVSRAFGHRFHIVAMSGRGLVQAANHIIERVTGCGYHAISYHTYRKGMRRILNRFGFEQTEQVREFDGTAETVHQLSLIRGSMGKAGAPRPARRRKPRLPSQTRAGKGGGKAGASMANSSHKQADNLRVKGNKNPVNKPSRSGRQQQNDELTELNTTSCDCSCHQSG